MNLYRAVPDFFGPPSTKYIFGPLIIYYEKTLKIMEQRIEPPILCRKKLNIGQ